MPFTAIFISILRAFGLILGAVVLVFVEVGRWREKTATSRTSD